MPVPSLAAIPAAPCLADDVARNVIGEPVVNLPETLDRSDAGLLIKFPQRRRPWVLIAIDAALRHLPDVGFVDVFGPFGTPADEDQAGAVEHHDADARTVGQILEARHIGRGMVQGARLRLARARGYPDDPNVKPQFSAVFTGMARCLMPNGRR